MRPDRQAELAGEELSAAYMVQVVMRKRNREDALPPRRKCPRPLDKGALPVIVGRCGLDQEHLALTEGVAVGVRRWRERGRARGKQLDPARNRPRPGHVVYRSTTSATASPPPMQSVARPRFAPRSFMAWTSVVRMRAPLAPMGW